MMSHKLSTGMLQHKRALTDGNDLSSIMLLWSSLHRRNIWSDPRNLWCTFSCSMLAMLLCPVVSSPQVQERYWTASTGYPTLTEELELVSWLWILACTTSLSRKILMRMGKRICLLLAISTNHSYQSLKNYWCHYQSAG